MKIIPLKENFNLVVTLQSMLAISNSVFHLIQKLSLKFFFDPGPVWQKLVHQSIQTSSFVWCWKSQRACRNTSAVVMFTLKRTYSILTVWISYSSKDSFFFIQLLLVSLLPGAWIYGWAYFSPVPKVVHYERASPERTTPRERWMISFPPI